MTAPALKPAHDLDHTLAALADPHRRQIIDLLREHPSPAGQLATATGLSPQSMSRHLRTLRQAGWVEERHDGFDARLRIYQLRPEPMADLARWLHQTEQLWANQLTAFKAHLTVRQNSL